MFDVQVIIEQNDNKYGDENVRFCHERFALLTQPSVRVVIIQFLLSPLSKKYALFWLDSLDPQHLCQTEISHITRRTDVRFEIQEKYFSDLGGV